MSEAFVGEIRMFAGNFAPRSYAFCDGQLQSIPQNDALFSLYGTIYGGDGRNTFGLPDLRGRIPIHSGNGPGLTPRTLGAKGGRETVTLTVPELPDHTHPLTGVTEGGTEGNPNNNVPAQAPLGVYLKAPNPNSLKPLQDGADPTISKVGGSQAHNNVMPFQCISFIVCLYGVYPSRS